MVNPRSLGLLLAALLLSAGVSAQTPPAGGAKPPGYREPDPKLVFDREVFSYPAEGRRDPFRPLVGQDAAGPLFDDLTLSGIIYSPNPRLSVILIKDGSTPPRTFRLHNGQTIGNARVIAIESARRVRFQVENYGIMREEIMTMAPRALVADLQAQQQATPAVPTAEDLLRAILGRRDSAQTNPVQPPRPGTQSRPTAAPRTPPVRPGRPIPPRRDTINTTQAEGPRGNQER